MTHGSMFRTMALAILCCSALTQAQNTNDYRSIATGSWGATATWERFDGAQWIAASSAPDSSKGQITIQAGHTITIGSDLEVDSVQVVGDGHIVISPFVIVTVGENNGLKGIDVDTTGSVTVNGILLVKGTVSGSTGAFIFNDGGVYDHARNAGSIPRSTWNTGSTLRLSGVTANNPSNTNQEFYNIEIDNANQNTNLNLGMSGNTIHGNVYVKQTGPSNRYYLTAPNAYSAPITILGDVIVTGGVLSTNGSSSAANIVVHVWGDVFVSNANFGASRGSGTNAEWVFHGDTVSFSTATLQNSVSSAALLQRFVFAKAGTQYLRMTNVTYGGSGTSPITMTVSAGTSLDIGTSRIPNGNTGSFILDSGATLITMQGAGVDKGTIETLADYGGGNSFLNILATAGTGTTSVTATKGAHPNSYNAAKSLQRYWTVTASPGITAADMTFYYFDISPSSTTDEVEGTETAYKALRYAGTGNGWYTIAGSTVDDLFDFVQATGQTTISGVWTVGETTPDPTLDVSDENGDVPAIFFVDQNFPNPFNPSTRIHYGIPEEGHVVVRIFDLLGREIATLVNEVQAAGTHTISFEGSRVPSGVYIYEVSTGANRSLRRMILMK